MRLIPIHTMHIFVSILGPPLLVPLFLYLEVLGATGHNRPTNPYDQSQTVVQPAVCWIEQLQTSYDASYDVSVLPHLCHISVQTLLPN